MRPGPTLQLFFLLSFIIFQFSSNNVYGQTQSEVSHSKKMYEGTWYNKTENRYIQIYYDDGENYVTINDWIKGKRDEADAYKAFIKNGKLILYAENGDHHASYCEMKVEDKKLIYQCNSMNFTDNFLNTKKPGYKTIFERVKKSQE